MAALRSVAASRDSGKIDPNEVRELEKLLLVDEVTEQWSKLSRDYLRDYVMTKGLAQLSFTDAILTARYIAEDPTLTPKQSILVAEIFESLVELKVWSETTDLIKFMQRAGDYFAVSKYESEVEANVIFRAAVNAKILAPVDHVELIQMRATHSYFGELSVSSMVGIQRLPVYAWAQLEASKARANKLGDAILHPRVKLVNKLSGQMHALKILDLVASPSKSLYMLVEKLNARSYYILPASTNLFAREKFLRDAIKNGAGPSL
ncbi:MAG: hypothetical protein EOP06_29685 [Proteobacteria bacterium]|nr:MAG: hypothetical protein EOP06_29685 [Pseudomonadota bacterium]